MELVDRIKVVMKVNNLSAAQMADDMGVQRSNVSHVLSGRNKPSFEFLNRLLTQYPKVNAHWLITGKSQSPEQGKVEPGKSASPNPSVKPNTPPEKPALESRATEQNTLQSDIDRIVIFYKNGTFKTFEQS